MGNDSQTGFDSGKEPAEINQQVGAIVVEIGRIDDRDVDELICDGQVFGEEQMTIVLGRLEIAFAIGCGLGTLIAGLVFWAMIRHA